MSQYEQERIYARRTLLNQLYEIDSIRDDEITDALKDENITQVILDLSKETRVERAFVSIGDADCENGDLPS